MGQSTFAVLYGIAEEGLDLGSEDEGTLCAWHQECADKIKAYDKRHGSWRGEAAYIPNRPYEASLPLLGFYIAVGASGKRGVPSLEAFTLSRAGVREAFPDGYKAARRRWRRFAKWAATQGVTLPKARLYLTETEVA